MGYSKLKIPKICEYCGKPFEAKTVVTRFCSRECVNKAGNAKKRIEREEEQKKTLLQAKAEEIAEIQTRPYISISEAVILFGISRSTIRRLINSGKLPATNLGERLIRISRTHIEAMFTAVAIPEQPQPKTTPQLSLEPKDCYNIGEISKKFGISESTVYKHIRKYSIPTRQVGNFVYAPKSEINQLYNAKK